MDIIRMNNMEFFGHTGCLQEEKVNGQRFVVSCEIFCDSIKGKITDDLNDTIDYSVIFEEIKKTVEGDKGNLIEHLAYEIAGKVLYLARTASKARVTVAKPDCPIDGRFDSMEVVIERGR